jgi:AcrR family transcriptional regulator
MIQREPIALSRKELYRRVWNEPLSVVAKDVGLSGNALAKICNRLLVPYPSRGYWVKVAAGKKPERPPLPEAPEKASNQIVFSTERASSRRARTRLDPTARREQLLAVAERLVLQEGLHATTMKRIAATAGISETQAYNYFSSREQLFGELARREFARIREARLAERMRSPDHIERVVRITRVYLRHIGQRGKLLQTLLGSPEVRALLRAENRENKDSETQLSARNLMNQYGLSRPHALGITVLLTTMCLRAGKVIADGKLPESTVERLCLALVVQGSRDSVNLGRAQPTGRAAP